MSGYEAKIEEIRLTAQAADRAGEVVRGVNAASAWPSGTAGMPGSKAMAKLESVRGAWQQIQAGTASDLATHAVDVNSAADRYVSNEQEAHDSLILTEAPRGGVKAI